MRQIWNGLGHAVDEINEDYGEDLLVQACLDDRMDPSRLWIQVKGTERNLSNTRRPLPSVGVKAEQILRWARSADLVVVVLWDVKNNVGYYSVPAGHFDHADLSEARDGRLPLRFSHGNPLNAETVTHLAWSARIRHANRSLQCALMNLEDAKRANSEENVDFFSSVIGALLADFTADVKIGIPGGGLTESFREAVEEAVRDSESAEIERVAMRATIRAIFKMVSLNCAGNGLPATLAEELASSLCSSIFGKALAEMSSTDDVAGQVSG
ncbi:DUF4365 domain-containing protein [Streptomyces sp. LN245]|uniref:DUF4365 domain-containing protein n=1 Tax=Streptomyces sp. LN245 TaxID=3112975 RepID=UPI00371EB5B9